MGQVQRLGRGCVGGKGRREGCGRSARNLLPLVKTLLNNLPPTLPTFSGRVGGALSPSPNWVKREECVSHSPWGGALHMNKCPQQAGIPGARGRVFGDRPIPLGGVQTLRRNSFARKPVSGSAVHTCLAMAPALLPCCPCFCVAMPLPLLLLLPQTASGPMMFKRRCDWGPPRAACSPAWAIRHKSAVGFGGMIADGIGVDLSIRVMLTAACSPAWATRRRSAVRSWGMNADRVGG